MDPLPFIIVAGVLFGVSMLMSRRRKALEKELGIVRPGRKARPQPPAPPPTFEAVFLRPAVAGFHVEGETARVRFDVPLPAEPDDILAELLTDEAIEVVREKRHSLPLSGLREVIALAGRGEVKEVGRATLETPGVLPPRSEVLSILNLSAIAKDPLERHFEDGHGQVPETTTSVPKDDLVPLSQELRLPKAVATGLRAQGIDPDTMSAGDLVTGLLRLFGYAVSSTGAGGYFAERGGEKTYIVEDRYRSGDHPELDEHALRRFVIEFSTSGAQRGMLVSEKYGPFEIYDMERRNPKVRFITRERLQRFVDGLSLA
jgi:hypothetical protein